MHTGQFAIPSRRLAAHDVRRTPPAALSTAAKLKGAVAAAILAMLLAAQLTVLTSAHAPGKSLARPAGFGDRVSTLTGP